MRSAMMAGSAASIVPPPALSPGSVGHGAGASPRRLRRNLRKMTKPTLFTPLVLRDIELRNRLVVSPMCQYSAVDGVANDWHFANLARFALGGFGLVFTEATAVHRDGRITHGDLGLWNDEQIAPLRRIAGFLKSQGAMPGIQLGHAGRKASMQRPWHGNGPMDASDTARGEETWRIVAPSPLPIEQGWLVPSELTRPDMN